MNNLQLMGYDVIGDLENQDEAFAAATITCEKQIASILAIRHSYEVHRAYFKNKDDRNRVITSVDIWFAPTHG